MMTKIVSAAAVLAIAGSALAQGNPWNMRGTVNFGDSPFVTQSNSITTNTSFFNDALGGSNGGPNPAFFAVFPALEFDSYWALGAGPNTTADGVQNGPYAGSGEPITVTSTLATNGAGFATPGVGADATLKEVNGVLGWALFLARLTTVGEGQLFATDGNGGLSSDAPFGRIGIWTGSGNFNRTLVLNGPGEPGPSGLDGQAGTQLYYLVAETQQVTINGVLHTVHDLYVTTAIPTPGAVALFGLAGLAAARRRRA